MNEPGGFSAPTHDPATRGGADPGGRGFVLGSMAALWKLLAGAFLGGFFLGGFLVAGWTARAAQREALRTWWRSSPQRRAGVGFAAFAAGDPATAAHARWPGWVLGDKGGASGGGEGPGFRQLLRRAFGGLVANARLGFRMIFNTAVLTLPGCLLWAGAWYAGWQNSFNKGYEHAAWGPGLFVLGMLLFSVAMGYVPMAQARQASTGDWRRFYDFRLVWRLIRRRWLAAIGLALAWAAGCAVVLPVKMMPALAQYAPALNTLPPDEASRASERFFGFAALFLFPVFVALRLLAARVYAGALRSAVQSGAVTEDELGEAEWHALRRLELLAPVAVPERGPLARVAAWLATRAGRIVAGATVLALWFGLSFLVVVAEFICKTEGGRGWWNQPMIHVPWFDYTPGRLRALAAEATKAAKTTDKPVPASGR